jgi:polysaccharide biosynthesis protein PslJ
VGVRVVDVLSVYLILLMFVPSSLIFEPLGAAGTPALVASMLIFVWYIVSWMAGAVTPSAGGRPVRIAMFGFAITALASFVAGMTRNITEVEVLSAERSLVSLVAWAGLIIVVSQMVLSFNELEVLLRRAVILGSVVASVGILEFFTGVNVAAYIRIPGLTANSEIAILTRSSFVRPVSTASQPIEFCVVMAMLLPFALHQAQYPARPGWLRRWLPVALIGMSIPMTVSRSGIVALAAAALFLVPTWSRRFRRMLLAASIAAVAVLGALAPGLVGTLVAYSAGIFGGSGTTSVVTRTSDYARDWPYVLQSPVFGRGFGTFLPQIYSYTDNTYLHELLECGVLGVISLACLYLAGMHCGAAGRSLTSDRSRRDFGQSVVAAMAVVMVASATFDSLSFPMFTGILFLLLGVAGAYLGVMKRDRDGLLTLSSLGRWKPPEPQVSTARARGL